jgi:hypothetical protein
MPHVRPALRFTLLLAAVVVLLLLVMPETAWAGPGGAFAKAAAKTVWGKIALGVLGVIFLPLILYVFIGEWIGINRTKKALIELAKVRPEFDWQLVSEQAKAAITDVYAVWESGDLEPVEHHLLPQYYSSQQQLLERWQEEGKRNVIDLHKISGLKPLFVRTETDESYAMIAVLLNATVIDYLEDTKTRKLLKGKKHRDPSFQAVWVFAYMNERWRVARIEEGNTSFGFAKLKNEIDFSQAPGRYPSQPVVTQAAQDDAAAQQEGRKVKVARGE